MNTQEEFIAQFDSWTPNKVVSVCFIEENGRWLMTRPKNRAGIDRSMETESRFSPWEAVGGKIEPEETPAITIQREIREELGTSIERLEQLGLEYANFSNKFRITMHIFRGQGLRNPPQETEVAEIKWFDKLERGVVWDCNLDYIEHIKEGRSFREFCLYDAQTNRLIRSATLITPELALI